MAAPQVPKRGSAPAYEVPPLGAVSVAVLVDALGGIFIRAEQLAKILPKLLFSLLSTDNRHRDLTPIQLFAYRHRF